MFFYMLSHPGHIHRQALAQHPDAVTMVLHCHWADCELQHDGAAMPPMR